MAIFSNVYLQKQITTLERKTTALQREVQERTEEIETTKRKLEQYKDYETVKSELEVLKVTSHCSTFDRLLRQG